MSRVLSSLVAVLVLSTTGVTQTVAPPPRDASTNAGTTLLRGRVVAADSGRPLRNALVRIAASDSVGSDTSEARAMKTDANGRYEFTGLRAGRYTISAMKGSYIALSYGQRRPNEPGQPLEVLDGQFVDKVDIALPRGGILTGRILDEFGEPAENVQVAPMQVRTVQGHPQLVNGGRVSMTNDIGEFRIAGLLPGQYLLSATLRSPITPDIGSDDRSDYSPTYYPGTPNLADASRLTVAVGQTVSDLALTLVPMRAARVTGVAVNSQGHPMAMGNVLVVAHNEIVGSMITTGGLVKPDGSFTVSGLAPGDYTLTVTTPGVFGDDVETATAQIAVAGPELNGVQLIAVAPSRLTGRIVVADAAAAERLQPGAVRLAAIPKEPERGIGLPGVPGRVNDDGTFTIKARPGSARIVLAGSLPGWLVRAVRLNGVDVTDAGFDVKDAEDLSGLEVELTNRLTALSGVVTNSRGQAVMDCAVVVFSTNREHWSSTSRFFRTSRPDQGGRFSVAGLPAAEYFAVALEALDPGEATSPELLDRASGHAVRFLLNDAETKTLDLKLAVGW